MRYLPHTPDQIKQMLDAIGVLHVDDLFQSIPPECQLVRPLALNSALDEVTLMRHLHGLADRNDGARMLSFQGAGAYDHHIPPAVDHLLLRGEFCTAYTPYQPEVSQGTLQSIWEFQTIVSEVLGQPVANASMYDAASATAEAALMARRLTRRTKVLLCSGVHPEYLETTRTYMSGVSPDGADIQVIEIAEDGTTNIDAIASALNDTVAAVVVGYPSFFGTITDLQPLAKLVHQAGALLVTSTSEPYALALIQAPGHAGADISVAEGQPIATSLSFGGPGVGLFACRDERKFLQELPGRIVGETVDNRGQCGYVLTLATREQHIRRERATSNICSNQGLVALSLAIRMCLLGKQGFEQVAHQCLAKALYLRRQLEKIPGFSLVYSQAKHFNEILVRVPRNTSASLVIERCAQQGVLPGVSVGSFENYGKNRDDQLLVAVTEKHSKSDLDRLVDTLRAC